MQSSLTSVNLFSVHESPSRLSASALQFVSSDFVSFAGRLYSQSAGHLLMRPAEHFERQITGCEIICAGNTRVFSGGGQTVDEHYGNQKGDKH